MTTNLNKSVPKNTDYEQREIVIPKKLKESNLYDKAIILCIEKGYSINNRNILIEIKLLEQQTLTYKIKKLLRQFFS